MFAPPVTKKAKSGAEAHSRAKLSNSAQQTSQANPAWASLALRDNAIQTKLAISAPSDPSEQEADRVAARVMNMTIASAHGIGAEITQKTNPLIQRQTPAAQSQDDWNFTPADLDTLHARGGVLRFGADSQWVPRAIQMTLLSALDQMLSTVRHVGSPATTGVSMMDLMHCHVVVPARSRVAASTPDRARLTEGLRAEERQTRQQFQNTEITDTNRAAFRNRLAAEQQAATPLLESVLQMPDAGIVLHSFEGNAAESGIPATSSQRNWFASFQTMTARPFEAMPGVAGFSSQWSAFMAFNFLVDSNGVIHVRPGSSGFQSLSDVTGRNEGGVEGLSRQISGLDQPSIAELAFRREDARQAARRQALASGAVELGVGQASRSDNVCVDSLANPSIWSHRLSRETPELVNSFHEMQRPPNFVLSGGRRFNLNPDHSVTPRMTGTVPPAGAVQE
jgi:hypothetical protein